MMILLFLDLHHLVQMSLRGGRVVPKLCSAYHINFCRAFKVLCGPVSNPGSNTPRDHKLNCCCIKVVVCFAFFTRIVVWVVLVRSSEICTPKRLVLLTVSAQVPFISSGVCAVHSAPSLWRPLSPPLSWSCSAPSPRRCQQTHRHLVSTPLLLCCQWISLRCRCCRRLHSPQFHLFIYSFLSHYMITWKSWSLHMLHNSTGREFYVF